MYNFGSIPFFASNNNLVEKNPSGIPSCTLLPSLSGLPSPEVTMRVNLGTWTNNPTGYNYNWYVNDILVSEGSTYEISSREVGMYIKCIITASNSNGRSSASTISLLII